MSAESDRLLLVPRWNGHASSDFYSWLTRRLAELGWRGEVEPVSLRPPHAPDLTATVAAVRGRLGAARASRTVLLGHSVGAQAVMRAIASLPPDAVVAGILLVAAWWTLDRPGPDIQPWIDTPFDWSRARAAARRRAVLLSTDDPHTADVARTRRLFEERLGATVRVHAGAAHFGRTEEPEVLASARDLLGIADQ